ncbi:type II 3-dehydroquinate dehydratase [Amaricoccus solimangrovi]|uniref:3-dehydroquinate dehydratase n=1 Tax=Amaricoccus solimangrovi TaxID=2589815 RepID=A0A501WKH5_9RHOB|nr:type II 3-dehydroquinate dehydratase [Amaricoccus solimangrovi]TPE49272.1 type II 3-dehydroquinate dehydratase [Amaricoccus solimangrovi]
MARPEDAHPVPLSLAMPLLAMFIAFLARIAFRYPFNLPIGWTSEAMDADGGIVINPAGPSFRSIPLVDAPSMVTAPVIEVHLSNIHARDEPHRHSLVSALAKGVIAGLGARAIRSRSVPSARFWLTDPGRIEGSAPTRPTPVPRARRREQARRERMLLVRGEGVPDTYPTASSPPLTRMALGAYRICLRDGLSS